MGKKKLKAHPDYYGPCLCHMFLYLLSTLFFLSAIQSQRYGGLHSLPARIVSA